MAFTRIPKLLRSAYPKAVWTLPSETEIYLTFDDGPCPGVTDNVLDILSETKFKATFFCIGEHVVKHPELYQRIIDEGHQVGNHSMTHQSGWSMNTKAFVKDVELCSQQVESTLFRPPYGRLTPGQYRRLSTKFDLVMYSVNSRDYQQNKTADQCLSDISSYLCPGEIILMHDNVKAGPKTIDFLPQLLARLTERGLAARALPSSFRT